MTRRYGFKLGDNICFPKRCNFSLSEHDDYVVAEYELVVNTATGEFVVGNGITTLKRLPIAGKLPVIPVPPPVEASPTPMPKWNELSWWQRFRYICWFKWGRR